MRLADTLMNLVSGLGTAKDKTVGNVHVFVPRTPAEIQAAYRGNWIARKIVDIVPFDMLREWRAWQADGPQIEAIEAAEKALGLQSKLLDALRRARRDGGAALLIGDGSPDPVQPLVPERMKKGGIRWVHVLGRYEITAGQIDMDLASPWFGEPVEWTMNTGTAGVQRIHPSRVIRLIGAPLLDIIATSNEQGWGDSVLQAVFAAVDQATSSPAYLNAMLPEAKQDVISVPGLSRHLATAESTKALTDRFAYAAQMKSMFGMLLLDGDGKTSTGEVFEQKILSFTGLPDVVRLFLSIAAGAADIPATRLLGKSPDGQNATGDSDIRNYYDRCAAEQRVVLTPAIARLDELLIRHALGERPAEVWYQWAPLYQPTQKEKADTLQVMATAIKALSETALVPGEILAQGTKGVLTDSGLLPGIDAAYDAHGDAPLTAGKPEADQFDENGYPAEGYTGTNVVPFPGRYATDAAPRTLYVSRKLINGADLLAWARAAGIPNLMPADALHVTIAYSRQPLDWMKVGQTWQGDELKIAAGGPRVMERFGDALVLLFASDELRWRWQEIRDAGASWDHPEYQPHVTLSWDAPDVDVMALQAYNGPLVFGPETFETVNEDWRETLTTADAAPLDDEEDEDEIAAVTDDELRALFGEEMLASATAGRRTRDSRPGLLRLFDRVRRRGGGGGFEEGKHPRGPGGRFAAKPDADTRGGRALAESNVGGDHAIVVRSPRVRKYQGHDTVESFVAAHPRGRAHALRVLAADHKAGRIGFAAPARRNDPLAALEEGLAAAKPEPLSRATKAAAAEPEPPPARRKVETPTKTEERVLREAHAAIGPDEFSVGIQVVRNRLTGMSPAEVNEAMLALERKRLAILGQITDPRDPRNRRAEFFLRASGEKVHLIHVPPEGADYLRAAHGSRSSRVRKRDDLGGGPNATLPFGDAYNPNQGRDGRGRWTSGAQAVADLVGRAAGTGAVERTILGKVTRPAMIGGLTKIDVKGFAHALDSQAVRHTMKVHGSAATEFPRGQKPITPADFPKAREIVARPDRITLGADRGRNGEPRIVIEKAIGGEHFTYVGEVRRGKRRIDMVTMWKR
ncbi:anti-CBASS protein Acb1 family protein [Methylobacterium sp. ID0610]|uniref:anti-CBASS protein Acb1 family protein n=1 Tax=Methylobacterium carpenticola TaxID=3344827 RepID=UPI0036B76924